MNLHHTDKISQWEKTDPNDWNFFQKIAARTNGVVTPGNVISLAGLALVMSGIREIDRGKTLRGISKVGVGRICDVLDGMAAEVTKTKSPLGEAIDAVIDKIEVAMAYPVLKNQGLVPEPILRKFRNQQLGNAGLTAIAKIRKLEIHPQKEGKLSMAELWVSTGLYCLSKAIEETEPVVSEILDTTANEVAASSIELGNKATYGYLFDACGVKETVNKIYAT